VIGQARLMTMKTTPPEMAIETTRELYKTLVSHGADSAALVAKSGINLTELETSDGRYPVSAHLNLWKAGESLLDLAAIGLQMGTKSDPYNRGIVGLVFTASANLEQAVSNKIRYTKILADHISLEFDKQDDEFAMTYSILEGYFHSYEIERVFAGFLNWVRTFIGQKINPVRLSFQYAQPSHFEAYKKHFQCPMLFDQPTNTITLPAHILGVENPKNNEYLYNILKEHAENVLSKVDIKANFVAEIGGMIAGRLCHGNFSAEEIAASLKVSKRTLNRKLSDEGATYQSILDDIRKEMAISYLEQGECSVQTIPYLLGYSESRGFLRAFKRWTGCSPKQYLDTD
jgi:AraC-like DNA-binding protein